MNCEEIELLLIDYINGELSIEINRFIEGHMSECSLCRKNFEETKGLLHNIHNISIPVEESNKIFLKESLLKELLIYRNTSPFLSALHRRKEEIKKQVMDGYGKDIKKMDYGA